MTMAVHTNTTTNIMMPVFNHSAAKNGLSVQIRNLSTDQVELRLDDKVATLSSAVAGSGERYVANQGLFGKGAEWHQKGSEAFFGSLTHTATK